MNIAISGRDIIDNKETLLADQMDKFLNRSKAGRFAVGYFFFAGLVPFARKLQALDEVRLLIGNTATMQSMDELAEGHRHLDIIQERVEALRYPKRSTIRRMELEAADNLRSTLSMMDQTDEGQEAVQMLIRMIEDGRLKVRVYTKGRLQARAYILDFADVGSADGTPNKQVLGMGIVGSSNLTLAEVSRNAELNVVVRGNDNHTELVRWFDSLWDESRDFDDRLMRELKGSWAAAPARPYDVYMKSLFTLVRDRLEDDSASSLLCDEDIARNLADFQRVAVEQAVQIIRAYNGVFVSDVVGLGKSYVGAAIVKHFERTHRCRPLIICPASLVDMWERYNEVYQLNARVLSMGKLREDQDGEGNILVDDELYQNRDFVLVDESHNFRHANTQRYRLLEEFLSHGKRCCFLTATPRNKSAWDVYCQLKLFHPNDRTDIPVSPPNLQEFFRGVEQGSQRLHDLLSNILIRRTRRDILKWYGYDAETDQRIDPETFEEYRNGARRAYVLVAGRRQFFPKRELETVEYSIDEAYQGLYQDIRSILGTGGFADQNNFNPKELTYARYGLWHYVLPDRRSDDRYGNLQRVGVNLRGLMRVLLFKRFESSVLAFRETIGRLLTSHLRFRQALQEGIVPAGEDAQELLNDPEDIEEQALFDSLRQVSSRYSATDFDITRLIENVEQDITLLQRIIDFVSPITPAKDTKLQTLLRRVCSPEFETGKCLIFTQYADTARYLHANLAEATGRDDIDVVCSNDKNRLRAVGRFAPRANPEYGRRGSDTELNILVATDALSEGLNLQDGNRIINYDLHWNPVRLIQRFGRIDRIGSEHDSVYGANFLPELGIEQQLGLRRVLANRIREIHESIGEDAAILDPAEQLNENAMYAIYEQRGGLPESIGEEDDISFDLNEATEMFRQMRKDDPAEFKRIANLPNGIRTATASEDEGLFVHCKAGRYQQLYLVNAGGDVVSRDLPEVLTRIRCTPETPGVRLPAGFNARVMQIQRSFAEEVKQREADRHHRVSLGHGQRYAIQQLRHLFSSTDDEDKKARINILEQALRISLPSAVTRELNRIRRNQLTGESVYAAIVDLYHHHGLRDRIRSQDGTNVPTVVPTLICSEALGTIGANAVASPSGDRAKQGVEGIN